MGIDARGALTLLRSFALAGLGAYAFHLIGFPAAPLTGAAVAGTLAALMGWRVGLPGPVRTFCFLVLGISIGATVTPDVVEGASLWPTSLAVLSAGLVLSIYLCRTLLERGFGADRLSATLASAPGHLSFVIAMAAEGRGNVPLVALVQSIRLLVLTLAVPPLLVFLLGPGGTSAFPFDAGGLGIVHLAALLMLSYCAGLVFLRWQVPAAHLMAGIVIGAAGQLTGLAAGAPPQPVLIGSLVAMGVLIGSRFDGVELGMLRRYALAGLAVTSLLLLVALVEALVVAALLGYPLDLLLAAYAPGGIETMAAIAVQTGLDSTFVAAHHVVRLLVLSILVPIAVARTT